MLCRRFPNSDEYTDYLAMFESAKQRLCETAHWQAFAVTDQAEKAYLTLDQKVKDDMILRRYIRGQPTDIQRILNVNHPMNLSMAVKTISRIHQLAQHYSHNRVGTPLKPQTQSLKVKPQNMRITSMKMLWTMTMRTTSQVEKKPTTWTEPITTYEKC